jgi:serine/threonine-protein phosphatase 2A regulatory subunit B'
MMRNSNTKRRSSSKKRESIASISAIAKPLTHDEHELLRLGLSTSNDMKSLIEVDSPQMRLLLLKRKIQLCLTRCDWNKSSDVEEALLITNKKKILLELLEFYSQRKFRSVELLQQSFRLLWLNLFRALPDPNSIKTTPSDDEMDFREPSWDHLVICYEIAFHVVTNTEIDKKLMQKYLRGRFLQNLVSLFASLDDREPQYVKIILHAIYGRFMALRKDIRSYLAQFIYRYIYNTKNELFDSNISIQWQGVPEILAIFCSIIQGLNIPVKQDYHTLVSNVLVPLHKGFHLDAYHEELVQCCSQFVLKDAHSACIVLGGMLKFWPILSPLKEQLFIDEIVHILNAALDYIEHIASTNDPNTDVQFEQILVAVMNRLMQCMQSPHHQVAERAILIWKEETLKYCLELYQHKIWPNLYNTFKKIIESYWLVEIRNITRGVIADLQTSNPEFFDAHCVSKLRADKSSLKTDDKSRRKERECRWQKIRQLAVSQINK